MDVARSDGHMRRKLVLETDRDFLQPHRVERRIDVVESALVAVRRDRGDEAARTRGGTAWTTDQGWPLVRIERVDIASELEPSEPRLRQRELEDVIEDAPT